MENTRTGSRYVTDTTKMKDSVLGPRYTVKRVYVCRLKEGRRGVGVYRKWDSLDVCVLGTKDEF